MNNNSLLAGLTKAAAFFVDKMKQRLSGGKYPSAISDAISIDTAKTEGNSSYIDITIDMHKGKAPMAAAFEFGSGEHAMRGNRGRYKIPAGATGYLAFPISKWPNYSPPPNVDVAVFPGAISKKDYVMHPGIEPNQYIAPTMVETKDEIAKMIGQSVKEAIMFGTEKVTWIEVKL
jgi:hypothetical protein